MTFIVVNLILCFFYNKSNNEFEIMIIFILFLSPLFQGLSRSQRWQRSFCIHRQPWWMRTSSMAPHSGLSLAEPGWADDSMTAGSRPQQVQHDEHYHSGNCRRVAPPLGDHKDVSKNAQKGQYGLGPTTLGKAHEPLVETTSGAPGQGEACAFES